MNSVASPFRSVSRLSLAVISLAVFGLASARANRSADNDHENALPTARQLVACPGHTRVCGPLTQATEFHSDLVGPDAVAFFFPPITVPPRPVGEPIPVTPHVPPPPPPPPPPHTPPPTDTAPEPATLISSALGAGILGLYSLRRRIRKH